jgi:hypothetical protein
VNNLKQFWLNFLLIYYYFFGLCIVIPAQPINISNSVESLLTKKIMYAWINTIT